MAEIRKMMAQLWQGLTPPQKLSIIATFIGSLAVLAAVVHFAGQPKLTLLYSGLAPAEAAKIVEYLQAKKIPHEIGDGGASVQVPASKVHEVRLALAGQGIPRGGEAGGGVGFEVFDKPAFGQSDFEQKTKYYRALQGELARTIKQMEEVQDARVLIVVPEERLFSRDRREGKASVFLKLQPGRSLTEGQVQALRFLVANGVENLAPNRVAIIDQNGRALAQDQQNAGTGQMNSDQLSVVRHYEEGLREKAQSMLDQVLGPGQSAVRVTVDMDFDALTETSEEFDPKKSAPRTETTTTESNNSRTDNPSGAAGVTPNTSNTTTASAVTSSAVSRENTTSQFEVGRRVVTRQTAVGRVRKVTTAVTVNSIRPSGGAAGQPAPERAKISDLERLVKAAVGYTEDAAMGRRDAFEIREMPFTDIFADQTTAPPAPSLMRQLDRYLPYISQGFLVVLAMAVFFYFRNLIRSSRNAVESREFSELLSAYQELTEATIEQAQESRNSRKTLSVDEMQRILREHPSNTAQAIKSWLGRN